jgi:hypothetical protein
MNGVFSNGPEAFHIASQPVQNKSAKEGATSSSWRERGDWVGHLPRICDDVKPGKSGASVRRWLIAVDPSSETVDIVQSHVGIVDVQNHLQRSLARRKPLARHVRK